MELLSQLHPEVLFEGDDDDNEEGGSSRVTGGFTGGGGSGGGGGAEKKTILKKYRGGDEGVWTERHLLITVTRPVVHSRLLLFLHSRLLDLHRISLQFAYSVFVFNACVYFFFHQGL